VTRRQQLTEVQIAELFDPPTDRRELVRHYTLSDADITMIRLCRGDHSRLGYALMLCYLRYPGRPLHANEQPAAALVAFVASQIDVLPDAINDYLSSEQNRRRHAVELRDRLRLRPFGTRPAAELTGWLLPHAIENDRLAHLAELVMEECRQRRIIIPRPQRLERFCVEARHRARREVQRRLTEGLTADQRRQLDALPGRRENSNQSWLAWLRQMPEAAKPVAMLGLIERLKHVRAIGLDPARGHRVHQVRLAQLAREASRTTAQHIADHERQRRASSRSHSTSPPI
jgi:hypothetical protein